MNGVNILPHRDGAQVRCFQEAGPTGMTESRRTRSIARRSMCPCRAYKKTRLQRHVGRRSRVYLAQVKWAMVCLSSGQAISAHWLLSVVGLSVPVPAAPASALPAAASRPAAPAAEAESAAASWSAGLAMSGWAVAASAAGVAASVAPVAGLASVAGVAASVAPVAGVASGLLASVAGAASAAVGAAGVWAAASVAGAGVAAAPWSAGLAASG